MRNFDNCRNLPFAPSLPVKNPKDELYGFVFILASMSSLRSVLLLFRGEKKIKNLFLLYGSRNGKTTN